MKDTAKYNNNQNYLYNYTVNYPISIAADITDIINRRTMFMSIVSKTCITRKEI